jgi:flavin-dependent dehydrogenase
LGRAFQMLPAHTEKVVETAFKSVLLNFQDQGRQFTAVRPDPLVRMTMRADLDNFLANEAQAAGARLLDACPVQEILPGPDAVKVVTAQGTFHARFIVAADGVQSLTAKTCGWPALPRLAPAIEWELELPSAEFARFTSTARFDFGFMPAGYAWVFPKREHLSVGILTTIPGNIPLATRLEEYLRFLGIQQSERVEKHGYVIPLETRPGPLAQGRVLLAGDAAGLVDPITAEGISYALLSGKLAAQAIDAGWPEPAAVAAGYQTLLERHILKDLRAARRMAHWLYHYPRLRHWAFGWQGQRLTNFVADVVMGKRGYAAALRDPRSYLKMLGRRP